MFFLALPLLFLASFNTAINITSKQTIPNIVQQISEEVFEEINRKWNKHLNWDKLLSGLALVEAVKPGTIAAPRRIGWLKIRANRTFHRSDRTCLRDKVNKTFSKRFEKKGPEVAKLPAGTNYGCNGVLFPVGRFFDYMRVVCLYISSIYEKLEDWSR